QSILLSAIILGNVDMRDAETMIAVFFIVFPAIVFVIVFILGFARPKPALAAASTPPPSTSTPEFDANAVTLAHRAMPDVPPLPASASPIQTPAAAVASMTPQVHLQAAWDIWSVTDNFMAFVGWILLAVATLMGIAAAVNAPGLFVLADHLDGDINPPPALVRILLMFGSSVALFLPAALLLFSPRPP